MAKTHRKRCTDHSFKGSRDRSIRLLKLAMLGMMTQEEVARALGIGHATLERRKRILLEDGEADTDDLRKLRDARERTRNLRVIK